MKRDLILRVVAKVFLPFILIFALYVQFHGDFGPGGGFQAGVIIAAAVVFYALIYGLANARRVVPEGLVESMMAAGVLIGLVLGLAVSVVLVHVVNPQSFHWTMQLLLPWGELLALCAAVLAAGIGTAAYSARAAASRAALLSVKEDW